MSSTSVKLSPVRSAHAVFEFVDAASVVLAISGLDHFPVAHKVCKRAKRDARESRIYAERVEDYARFLLSRL